MKRLRILCAVLAGTAFVAAAARAESCVEFAADDTLAMRPLTGQPVERRGILYRNGDRYEGDTVNLLRHGRGLMVFADGTRYDGDWRCDQMTGRGVMTWPNGDRYEGELVNGVRSGTGDMRYANGGHYSGEWRRDTHEGQGVMVWPNGQQYTGAWRDGSRHGHGTHSYSALQRYEGEWRDDKRVDLQPAPAGGEAAARGPSAAPPPSRVFLGMTFSEIAAASPGSAAGSRIDFVAGGGPADAAGLHEGDVVLAVAGKPAGSTQAFAAILAELAPGKPVPFIFVRDNARHELPVTPGARTENATRLFQAAASARVESERKAGIDAQAAGDTGRAFPHYVKVARLAMFVQDATWQRIHDDVLVRMGSLLGTLVSPPLLPAEADRRNRSAIAILRTATTREDYERAARESRLAIFEAPWSAKLYLNSALVLEQAGQLQAARQSFSRYLLLAPNAPNAETVRSQITALARTTPN